MEHQSEQKSLLGLIGVYGEYNKKPEDLLFGQGESNRVRLRRLVVKRVSRYLLQTNDGDINAQRGFITQSQG